MQIHLCGKCGKLIHRKCGKLPQHELSCIIASSLCVQNVESVDNVENLSTESVDNSFLCAYNIRIASDYVDNVENLSTESVDKFFCFDGYVDKWFAENLMIIVNTACYVDNVENLSTESVDKLQFICATI